MCLQVVAMTPSGQKTNEWKFKPQYFLIISNVAPKGTY